MFKDWFLGFEEEVFVVDSHQGVRPQEPPRNEAQWSHRGLQYFKFVEERRAVGLPPDIYETEPDFLMEPLPEEDQIFAEPSLPEPQDIPFQTGDAAHVDLSNPPILLLDELNTAREIFENPRKQLRKK